ncbi:RCC1/BLIP-II [Ascobolus immersus RN42]|uniref:RCC1/BLIP-II n=1 Tax=Ascobolus immersus RN42 TaxID=1160509 RepID=A0A3N4IJ75_ASCIM|nr:RCC1/BLIP-II [Ascobolus immersus RN42]
MLGRPVHQIIQTSARRACGASPLKRNLHTNGTPASKTSRSWASPALALTTGATFAYLAFGNSTLHAEAKSLLPGKNSSVVNLEDAKDLNGWTEPGVYLWGDNRGRVIAPESSDICIRNPRRISFFDGKVLRDLRIGVAAAVAVSASGDIYQWGVDYDSEAKAPELTLKGKNIERVEMSTDTIFALSKDGMVYSVPISRKEQLEGKKPKESALFGLSSTSSPISYRILQPALGFGEKVSGIAAGDSHLVLLTSAGNVFTAAASADYPTRGQLGIKSLTWATRPPGPFDMCHRVELPKGSSKIVQIAAGDLHSVLLDSEGKVYTFGDNTFGQCGFDADLDKDSFETPTRIPSKYFTSAKDQDPHVRKISAGGNNTFYIVDSDTTMSTRRGSSNVETEEVYASGKGIWGNLGNGKWTHMQGHPTRIKALSRLFEFDDATNSTSPIRVAYLAAGKTHSAAVLSNKSHANLTEEGTNIGSDVLFWGANQTAQLGNGKKNNFSSPQNVLPLRYDRSKIDILGGPDTLIETKRLQVMPPTRMKTDAGNVVVEQRVYCGAGVSAVYSKVK